MKNIIFLVIDSLMESHVLCNNTTPFLDSIKEECFIAKNIYSQGPFTEAGTKGLLTSSDTLDDCNYLFRYDASKNFITKIFKESGYKTVSLIYPTCLYSNKILKYIDNVEYTSGMMFDVFWNQKFKHYIDLYKQGKFDNKDLDACKRLIKIIFEAWMNYTDPEHPERRLLLQKYDYDYDYQSVYKLLSDEYCFFLKNPDSYIYSFLKNNDIKLNYVEPSFIHNFIKNEQINIAFNKNATFQKKLKKKQFFLNLRNNHIHFPSIKEFVNRLKDGINRYTFGELAYYIETLNRGKDIKKCKTGHDYKLLLSAKNQFDRIAEIIKESNDPVFITAHVEEPHYFTTYFSFDFPDIGLINEEIKYAEDYIDSISKNYKGLISYDLAIRYVDKQLENLFKKLENSGQLNNTIIVITADHGSSYNCYPPRNIAVNNCHSENYHIPFIIYEKGRKGCINTVLSSNKDIIPTVLEYANINYCGELKGHSILKNEKLNDFITTEYMGSGCPDIRRNKAYINVRSDRYLLAYEGRICDKFNENGIYAIYDLINDPLEIKNIKKIRNNEIENMIEFLKNRIKEIVENNKEWL